MHFLTAAPVGTATRAQSAALLLDRDITAAELDKAIDGLANRKASDPQLLVNELITRGGPRTRAALLYLFRAIWAATRVPDDWLTAHLVPIYKGAAAGTVSSPASYRPIALTSIVAKLYESVLYARLSAYTEANGIIGDEQGGFRRGRSCIDHAFILGEIIAARRERHKRTFMCFLDLSKAYDRTWRDGIWHRLLDVGVNGRIWHAMRGLYRSVQTRVSVNGELGDAFSSGIGVRQGSVLSPILFSIFISSVIDAWRDAGLGVTIGGGDIDADSAAAGARPGERRVAGLLFADDIVLIADSEDELHRALAIMDTHAQQWRYSFNSSKCAVMVAAERQPPSGRHERHWQLQGEPVVETKQYRYLGITLQSNSHWTAMQAHRTAAGKAALPMLWRIGARQGRLSMSTGELLIEMLLWSRMAYGSELSQPGITASNKAETIQNAAGRALLGVPRGTSNDMVRGELGWLPLAAHRRLAMLRYLGRLQHAPPGLLRDVFRIRMASAAARFAKQQVNVRAAVRRADRERAAAAIGDADDVALRAAEEAGRAMARPKVPRLQPIVRGWCAAAHATLTAHGLGDHFSINARESRSAWSTRCRSVVSTHEQRQWSERIAAHPRDWYRLLKPEFGREPYIDVGDGIHGMSTGRRIKAQMRTLSAPLAAIRAIRYPDVPPGPICQRCTSGHEDWPPHAMCDCLIYHRERVILYAIVEAHWRAAAESVEPWWLQRIAAGLPDWSSMTSDERCRWLLSDRTRGICAAVARFLFACRVNDNAAAALRLSRPLTERSRPVPHRLQL